jgi:23S rRNA (uracil1939-C5)-methyltransferase
MDALERIGGFAGLVVKETLGADEIYFYRNKMEFSFGDRWLAGDEFQRLKEAGQARVSQGSALGLHPAGRFDKVLEIDECWLQSSVSNRVLRCLREALRERSLSSYSTHTHEGYLRNLVIREGRRTGERMVNVVTSEDRADVMQQLTQQLLNDVPEITTIVNNITARRAQVATGEYERVYHGPGFITERLGGLLFRISANSFFQTNTAQAERLYVVTKRMAQLEANDVVYDLYSGTGTIALFLADKVAKVVGIEMFESAVLDARRNAELNGISNCWFEIGDLKAKLTTDTGWIEQHGLPNVIIIDPPRSGMHPEVLERMIELKPRRMVYVSCNPSTQARDLKLLCEKGEYVIEDIQPVDMFPHTYHIENVVGLRRGESRTPKPLDSELPYSPRFYRFDQ